MAEGKHAVLIAYGTSAEAIKLAPMIIELRRSLWIRPVAAAPGDCGTALDEVQKMFGIVPEMDLDLAGCGPSLLDVVTLTRNGHSASLARSAAYVRARGIDAVVVEGNTPTALAVALVGFQAKVPVIHVDAGVRTMPGHAPANDEGLGTLVAQVASLHLAATPVERANLVAEGVDPDDVVVTGRLTIDARMAAAGNPLGDGLAVTRARAAIEASFGAGRRLPDFTPPVVA